MDCPNCDKRPVKRFYSFRLNGATFKEYIKGYIRCQHCGTLLKQAMSDSGLKTLPKYKKGFWKWFVLALVLIFGLLMGIFILLGESDIGFWFAFPVYVILLAGVVLVLEEIKTNYWILEEVEDIEEDRKKHRRMGALGWTILLGFIAVMLGGLVAVDRLYDTEAMPGWQSLVGLILYLVLLVVGSLGIFQYFSETGELPEHSEG